MAAVLVGLLVAHILIQLLLVHLFFTSNFSCQLVRWKCFIGLHWPTINQTMIGYAMISGGKVQVLKGAKV